MNLVRKPNIFFVILFVITGLLFANIFTACSNEYESLKKEHRTKAIQQFNEKLYFKDLKQSDRQLMIDGITGRKNFTIFTDEVHFSETDHLNFPFTANRTTNYQNTNYKNEIISVEQLFIYEDIRGIWIPISIMERTIKDGKITSSLEEDLWDEKNDWAEVFKKEHISDEEMEEFLKE